MQNRQKHIIMNFLCIIYFVHDNMIYASIDFLGTIYSESICVSRNYRVVTRILRSINHYYINHLYQRLFIVKNISYLIL